MRDAMTLAAEYAERCPGKLTPQRLVVLDALAREPGHVTAEELHVRIRQGGAAVSQATIYRALKLLVRSGVVTEVAFGDGTARYELADRHTRHAHLVCTRCGKSVEFEDRAMQAQLARIARTYGFALAEGSTCLYGLCDACAQERPGPDTG